MKTYPAILIADALISFSDPDKGDLISNLKVQKLLYYAQGLHLALYKSPLFEEAIVKWQYGPVVPEVYGALKQFGGNAIPVKAFDYEQLSPEAMDVLKEIDLVYGQFSAIKLMNMTHDEPPFNNTDMKAVISQDELTKYFTTLLEN